MREGAWTQGADERWEHAFVRAWTEVIPFAFSVFDEVKGEERFYFEHEDEVLKRTICVVGKRLKGKTADI